MTNKGQLWIPDRETARLDGEHKNSKMECQRTKLAWQLENAGVELELNSAMGACFYVLVDRGRGKTVRARIRCPGKDRQ